jgi:GNAT superfamily N-acetyltransferase
MISIRASTIQDIPRLVGLVRGYKQESGRQLSRDDAKQLEQQFHGIAEDPSSDILVAHDDDDVVGYLAYHLIHFPLLLNQECYISDLIIRADQRGKRIGTLLLQEVEAIARQQQCCRMMLNNGKDSLAYQRSFYVKCGFVERYHFGNFVKNIAD